MTDARLTSVMLATALMRMANQEGGFAAVLNKGDETSGCLLLQMLERGAFVGLFERLQITLGVSEWTRLNASEGESRAYLDRRRGNDPDLWIIELDVPVAQRFIAKVGALG